MRGLRRAALAAALYGLTGCGPNLGDLEKGEDGRVAQVIDGDTLILEDGLRVTLTEIEAPYGDAPFAAQARAGLEQLALARPARLAYGGLRRFASRPRAEAAPVEGEAQTAPAERDAQAAPAPAETALAQVYVRSEGGRWIWLQGAMVEQGFAYARPRKDNHARTAELLAAEARARAAERGLWSERAYAVRTPAQMEREAETLPERCGRGPFRIVEGRVRSVSANENRAYLNFGEDYRTDFTIAVYGEDAAAWRASGPDFLALEGQNVRARGRAGLRGGPLLCLEHPSQLEVLPAS
ncbi:MAG: thermonuclease family protein [Alphaproteobacteria bacterium]|nr:thermonuclease family protein [Alphaproteobacteria bacterium]